MGTGCPGLFEIRLFGTEAVGIERSLEFAAAGKSLAFLHQGIASLGLRIAGLDRRKAGSASEVGIAGLVFPEGTAGSYL